MLATISCLAALAGSASAQSDPPPAPSVVATALAKGDAALVAHDADGLMAAALILAESHARSGDGDDLARSWAHQAVLWGAKPRAVSVRRGRILGPGYRQLALPPGAKFRTSQVFAAGRSARVELVAMSKGAFSLTIVEQSRGEICRRSGTTGQLACNWVPIFSAPNDIMVENNQPRANRFYLVTD